MDMAKALEITPKSALKRNLWRTQMDQAKTLGITLEPVLLKYLHMTQMDTVKAFEIILEPILDRHLYRTQLDMAKRIRHYSKACLGQTSLEDTQMDVAKILGSTPKPVL